jgi:hypothetical protein
VSLSDSLAIQRAKETANEIVMSGLMTRTFDTIKPTNALKPEPCQ